ncbi:MAG: DUF892 family protein [Gemmatimonadota bacterium]
MTDERTSARERYLGGLESLLALEIQTDALVPTMAAYAGCERLRRFFDELPPMIRRQRRRLELLLNAFPERTDARTASRNGLEEDLREIGGTHDRADRDAELINAAAWIFGLQIEQYGATRDLAMRLGDFEAARHLQRSLNAAGALSLRLFRISRRIRHGTFGFPLMEVGDFDRLPAHTGALP